MARTAIIQAVGKVRDEKVLRHIRLRWSAAVYIQANSSTYDFLADRIKPAFIHVFPYSRRAGTRAAERPDQVQDSVKTARVQELEQLSERLHREFIVSNRGLKCKVLFESTEKNGMMSGYTENYIRVERPFDRDLTGKIAEVEL